MRTVLAAVAGLAWAGCATVARAPVEAAPVVRASEEFTLALGKSALVANMGYLVIFDSVAEDSRCPVNTTCIWEGNARVALRMRKVAPVHAQPGGDPREFALELNTSNRFERKREFEGYVVELRRLEPVPSADAPTPPYAATLVVVPK